MRNILFITLIFFVSYATYAQELAADDYVIITQENEAYPGFQAKTYRGLFSVGHGQFKMYNYGGTPGNISALGANQTLGSFVFNGYDGSSNVISAVIQAQTITNSRDPRINFLLSNGVGSQRPNRLTIIGQTGFVGIGATNPTEKLDVAGRIRMRTGANAGYIPVSDANGKMTWTDPSTILSSSPWTISGSDVYRASGEVGIGGSPSAALHIKQTGTGIANGIRMTSSVVLTEDWYTYMNANDDLVFRDDGTDVLILQDSSGNVGIGETDPGARLHIETNSAGTTNGILSTVNYVGTGYDIFGVSTTSVPGDGYGYGVYTTGGYKGIYGRATAGAYTGGAMGVQGYATGSAGTRYGIYGSAFGGTTNYAGYFSGDANVTGTFTNPSDRKLKQNIESYTDALEVISQLEAKTYDYKKGEFAGMGLPSQHQIGFIAQELEEVLPNLVTNNVHPEEVKHDEEGKRTVVRGEIDYKGINYIGLIPVLTQGIKELATTVEEKEEVIEALAKDNATMKTEMSAMTAKMDEMTAMMESMNDKFNKMEEDMSSCCLSGTDNRTGSANTNVELNGADVPALEQNTPNPFYEQTVIKYYIPSVARTATMTITDIKGSPIKSVNLAGTGLGTVTINANELPVGTYVYTLFIDGKQVESKQMVLVK